MLAFVVNGGQPDERLVLLEQLLARLGYIIARKDTVKSLVGDPELKAHKDSLVLIPTTAASNISVAQVVDLAIQLKGHAFIIHVADEISPSDYKVLIRTGAADSVSWDSAKREIYEICQRQHVKDARPRPHGDKSGAPHTVISFVATGGGAGNTTMAIETGVYLASLRGKDARRVAVVDLDFQRSVMCDYLNLPPGLDIGEFMRNPQRLDDYMLDIFASKHHSGLDLFASEDSKLDYSAINESSIFSLLDRLIERYDTVLLDIPRYWTAWMDRILMNSELVFVTGQYSVPAVKKVAFELKHLRNLKIGPEKVGVIINGCQKTLLGGIVRKADVDSVLAGQRIFYVQQDLSFALECVNIGSSLIETRPRHGVCRDIKKIGEAILAAGAEVTP